MHARTIQVKNGRLVFDEATDLPDGAEVEILVIDDELTAEERAELHASLDRALDDSDAGRGMDAWESTSSVTEHLVESVLLNERFRLVIWQESSSGSTLRSLRRWSSGRALSGNRNHPADVWRAWEDYRRGEAGRGSGTARAH